MVIMRKEYVQGPISHRKYYGQFVSPGLRIAVADSVGHKRLLGSEDPHLNDIQLQSWDSLAGLIRGYCGPMLKEANGNDGISLSDCVCVAKEAARQWIEEESIEL